MNLYVDPVFSTAKNERWPHDEACHLLTFDNTKSKALQALASKLGLSEQGYHQRPNFCYYGLTPCERMQALALGVEETELPEEYMPPKLPRRFFESSEHPFGIREEALKWVATYHPPYLYAYEQNVLMYGTPDVPGHVRSAPNTIPNNMGIPTSIQPQQCMFCRTPIWRWNRTKWVCCNCKIYDAIRGRGSLNTLDDCFDSGYSPVEIKFDRKQPDHPCYRCDNEAWIYDSLMKNYRCAICSLA